MAYVDLYDDTNNPYQAPPQPNYPTTPMHQVNPNDVLAAAERSAGGYSTQPSAPLGPRYQGGGVDLTKWMNQQHGTPKYEVLRYLDQFNPQVLGRAGLLGLTGDQRSGLERLGYQIRDEDKIFRNDIGEIDVLHGDRSQYGWRLTGVGNVAPTRPGAGKGINPPGGVSPGGPGNRPGTPGVNGISPGGPGNIPSQFTDPLTRQYEELLKQQTNLYQQQQLQMQSEAARQQGVRDQTDAAVKRLMEYVNQRVGTLQQPAYTGREQEVLRTQYLDPIERDRQATQRRALDNVGSRGFDPSSGIAQDLFRQIDQGFNEQRSGAQGDIAFRQIMEERQRQQEAQELLQYAAGVPEAAARGDLGFVNYLNTLINQPGQEALATSAMLAQMPMDRTLLGSQVLGLGGQPQGGVQGALQLLQNAQANRMYGQNQSANYWGNLGRSFYF